MITNEPESGRLVGESHPLVEQDTPTFCYRLVGEGNGKVVAFLRDKGTTNALWPVVVALARAGSNLAIVADGPGEERLKESGLGFSRVLSVDDVSREGDLLLTLNQEVSTANVVLVGHSGDPGDLALVSTAKTTGAISVAIQDFPGYLFGVSVDKLSQNFEMIPDVICVPNEWSRERLVEVWPQKADQIFVTGSPAFDNLLDEEVHDSEYKSFRKNYEIAPDEKVIVWVGDDTGANLDAIRLLIAAVKEGNQKVKLVLRRHPNDKTPQSVYTQLISDTGIQNIVLETANLSMDSVRQAADLVVSIISTEILKATCEKTLAMAIMPPEIIEKSGHAGKRFSFAEDGTVAVVRDAQKVQEILKKVLSDFQYQEELRGKMGKLKIDGHATDRIVNLVKKLFG